MPDRATRNLLSVLSTQVPSFALVDADPCGFVRLSTFYGFYEKRLFLAKYVTQIAKNFDSHYNLKQDSNPKLTDFPCKKLNFDSCFNFMESGQPKSDIYLTYRIGSWQMSHEDSLVSPNLRLLGVLPR